MRVKLVAGNWKMNGSLASSQALIRAILPPVAALNRARFAVCPPYPYLAAIGQVVQGSNVALGAQDVSSSTTGRTPGRFRARCWPIVDAVT